MDAIKTRWWISGRGKVLDLRLNSAIQLAAVFLSCFVLSFVVGSLVIRRDSSGAVTGLGLAAAPTMSIATNNNTIALLPVPNVNSGLASGFHVLTAGTNVPTGYSLTLSMSGAPTLPTTAGTIASPVALANNTWGYALASAGAVGVVNGFDNSYAVPTPSVASRWANPAVSTVIKNTAAAAANDTTDVYYGVKVDMSLASGTYTNPVTYTAVANISNIPTPSITSITPTSGTTAGGTAVTIVGTGFTVDDQSVTTAVTIGGTACASVSISSNTPATGQDTIYCNTPAHVAGAVNVVVTTWGGTAILTNGYTYTAPASVTFVSPSIASTIAGSESGPVFTIVGTNFSGATDVMIGGTSCASITVISNTQIFCKAPNNISVAGNKAVVVVKGGLTSNENITVAYNDTDYPTLQAGNAYSQCSTTAQIFRDTRDSQLYYVKKMVDNKCWMVDNLKYANYGTLSQVDGQYLTVDGTNTQNSTNYDVAKYVDPGAVSYCTGNANLPANTNTRCGLLYNWYAATAGSSPYAQATDGKQANGSICPANFRLPSGLSGTGGPTTDGTLPDTADFTVLNASMNAGALVAGTDANYPAGWMPSGAWGGTLAGSWESSLGSYGSFGNYWSSTVYSGTVARSLNFYSSYVSPNSGFVRSYGYAVRCVMDESMPVDVSPTTGWAGDTVTITGKDFVNVTSVTIGGTACTSYQVISTARLTCVLPSKTAGTSNEIAVVAGGVNVTPQTTYTQMKITYFNPSASTVSIGGTTYNFYPNGFTSANCSAMTASNAVIGSTPAASLAYVRDTRNNQTYRVKKMVDNKCWMVDNLKYVSTTIANVDGTTGMIFNNQIGAYNSVNGLNVQSAANIDKAFYNNPAGVLRCYDGYNTPANTLTSCGYLYNWYAATNGTGAFDESTAGNQVSGNVCPVNFRLPSGSSGAGGPTTNGTLFDVADIPVLNASMNAGVLTTGSTGVYYAGWLYNGAWGGSNSGVWSNGLNYQGAGGYYWSSTANATVNARYIVFSSGTLIQATTGKFNGLAVRCVLP